MPINCDLNDEFTYSSHYLEVHSMKKKCQKEMSKDECRECRRPNEQHKNTKKKCIIFLVQHCRRFWYLFQLLVSSKKIGNEFAEG